MVSILTRPWGRVQPRAANAADGWGRVSILTRPWGRVQRTLRRNRTHPRRRFNPHPPVGAGATETTRYYNYALVWVSILTRPWGRVQQYAQLLQEVKQRCFNPHPPVGAGATSAAPNAATSPVLFQSSPTRGGGCNATMQDAIVKAATEQFQSSPARGGGCNTCWGSHPTTAQ